MAQHTPLAARFGRQVRLRREALRLSAQELAERCEAAGYPKLNRDVIASIENKRRYVTLDEAACLAHVLATASTDTGGRPEPRGLLVSMLAAAAFAEDPDLPPGSDWLTQPQDWLAQPPADAEDLASELAALDAQVRQFSRKVLGGTWMDLPKHLTWADIPPNLTYADLADPNPEA